jgi:molybdate transport system substrate-binding protein
VIFPPPTSAGRIPRALADRLAFSTVPLSKLSGTLSSQIERFFVIALLFFSPHAATAQSTTLTVAAAADLVSVEPAIASSFKRVYPRIGLRFVTAASGVIRQQIENGAPYDVFLSANARYLDDLVQKGLVRNDSAVDYAEGELGIAWRDHAAHPLSNLASPAVRFLALPNPKLAPYGRAAEQALVKLDLWRALQSKIAYGENVQQAWQLFESGNADAVITSWSILYNRGGALIDASLHTPIIQRGGIVASTTKLDEARIFLRFLTSPEGARILAAHGLRSAPSAVGPSRPKSRTGPDKDLTPHNGSAPRPKR